jgi:hypothetical protein
MDVTYDISQLMLFNYINAVYSTTHEFKTCSFLKIADLFNFKSAREIKQTPIILWFKSLGNPA